MREQEQEKGKDIYKARFILPNFVGSEIHLQVLHVTLRDLLIISQHV